ncbi:FAD/NAD(P)-binding protein [Pseudaeromonas sp. ZJS20]|uniref:FAD/NAD(P)-binding protein n=1 Tax=Pseudaeromonas aegiceratis TaxID=3153928 RepID=UPI00390C477F
MTDPYLPRLAEVVENRVEIPEIHTLALRLLDGAAQPYHFACGQFNMLCLPGVGEIPISVMDKEGELILHTVKGVGRVSRALIAQPPGSRIGLRGPFGSSWPLELAKGRDLLFITAGLGCAPVVGAIRQVIARRADYGRLVILQGVKHSNDLLWEPQYQAWRQLPDTQVLLAASEEQPPGPDWTFGMVTVLLEKAHFDKQRCLAMLCGPEAMLIAAMRALQCRGIAPEHCFLSLERNMQCGLGLCGHCQMGPHFLCKEGPIFPYPKLTGWLENRGY